MVYIVTGSINSGKTSRLLKLYKMRDEGDGFVAIKNMTNDRVTGYDMIRLSTNERRSFIVRDTMVPEDFETLCKIGPYCFSKATIQWVEHSLRYMVAHGVSAIFLDEIGPLELEGQCFDGILSELVDSGCDLYITVRQAALDAVLDRYNILEYQCIDDVKLTERQNV